jgi:hypothetical protein
MIQGDGDLGPRLRSLLQAEVDKRVKFHPAPVGIFDPRTAKPEELAMYGLPPRPDRTAPMVVQNFWNNTYPGPITFAAPTFSIASIIIPPITVTIPTYRPRAALAGGGRRHHRSENWSGASLTAAGGGMFTEIHGMWQVPTPTMPPGGSATTSYRSSTWVGLDGQRRYFHSSLPQIGTSQFIEPQAGVPTPIYGCWWQWWHRDRVFLDVPIALPVKAGDLMSCSIVVLSPTTVRFSITNVSDRRPFPSFVATAPEVPLPGMPNPVQAKISGATAEWVMERPTRYEFIGPSIGPGALYELPSYGTVTFMDCYAVRGDGPGAPQQQDCDLTGARYINMYERRWAPARTTDISVANGVSASMATTVYRAP